MAGFEMCSDCQTEYDHPENRRFHAQPIACPACGPHLWLEDHSGEMILEGEQVINTVQQMLSEGQIIAVKGLGGFHLACNALNFEAVQRLRRRKLRIEKPFAIMMLDIQTVKEFCLVSRDEEALLESRERPIVILNRKEDSQIAQAIAPGQKTLGVMLPYTPLHYLLLAPSNESNLQSLQVLVMTSGNISEEPIAYDNIDALDRLSLIADAFLMHDRPIYIRCDDSVVHSHDLKINDMDECTAKRRTATFSYIRRSRGYAPTPISLPWDSPSILGCGPELKNTFCFAKGPYAFISHHIGDLENYETLQSFNEGIRHFENLFKVSPERIIYDLHPNYLSTHYAERRGTSENIPSTPVQHHHAHITSCMVDNGISKDQPVIGVALDGTGYGTDGAIWGGEFLIATYSSFSRAAHLKYIPLIGGDIAIREPWRMALSWLIDAGLDWDFQLEPTQIAVRKGIDRDIFENWSVNNSISVPTSSMGRLFDAAASLAGIRQVVNYEAQAAIEFEALIDHSVRDAYDMNWHRIEDSAHSSILIDPLPLISNIYHDALNQVPISKISAKFHNSIIQMILDICLLLSNDTGIKEVALSGGVWQNIYLLEKVFEYLSKSGLTVLVHKNVPTNDGGISLGQVAIGKWVKN